MPGFSDRASLSAGGKKSIPVCRFRKPVKFRNTPCTILSNPWSFQKCFRPWGSKNFIIEVQLSEQTYFSERAIFYSARAVAQKAEQGRWDYHFAPVFFLGFLNFDMPHLPGEVTDPGRFIHKFSLREDETHEQMSRALRFAFLEVARFDKSQDECESFEERFLYLMKNLPTFPL